MYSLAFSSCSRTYIIPAGVNSNFLLGLQYTQYGGFPDANFTFAIFFQFTQYAELVNCSFYNNFGTALGVNNTNLTLSGTNEFTHNHCGSSSCTGGGGITALNSNLTFTGNTTFLENFAISAGAGIHMTNCTLSSTGTINFIGNSAENGGAIYAHETTVSFSGTNNYRLNSASAYGAGGGAIYTSKSSMINFTGSSNFDSNFAPYGGAIYAYVNATLIFNGTVSFTNNGHGLNTTEMNYGGGIYIAINSTFSILPNTTINWENNYASLGGAIYVHDSPFIYCTEIVTCIRLPKEECFFQLPGLNLSDGVDVQLVFKNNSADGAGSVLYGGAIDNCRLTGLDSNSSGEVFDSMVVENNNTLPTISSDAFSVCPCKGNYHPDCYSNAACSVYPGETFYVSVAACGQRNGTVSAYIISRIDRGNLQSSQYRRKANGLCTKLSFTVLSVSDYVTLKLYAEGPCSTFGDTLIFSLNINRTCPPGFNFSKSEHSCVCAKMLQKYTGNCNISSGLGWITRDSGQNFWVGYDNGLILHPHCPFHYCKSGKVVFPLNNTDLQCAENRIGLLCGKCKENYSIVLGTARCKQCTNSHLALLIPFALMGVALVFLLLVCKLTVATGTLSGLVFYANIVEVNRTIFLPVEYTDALSTFIAWLNLDFGIETCFYDGMDAYSNTWLQFAFPVYIWMLVGLMVFISNYSHRFAKLLGSNPVSVLATLILLSYTKILCTLIASIHVTYLEYATYNRSVWLYDANIDYLSGKHIPLFIASMLIFVFLFVPYTLLLLFGQWLQAISHLQFFSWVNSSRLKAFMDSYHAPYKAKHRYWPGLLLVLRFALLLEFALNSQQDPSINLLTILVVAGILQLWVLISGGVYTKWYLDALEGSFTLNLIILVGATLYDVNPSEGNQAAAWYTSVSIAFVTFLVILACQIFQQLSHTKLWKKFPKLKKFNKLTFKQSVNDSNYHVSQPTEAADVDRVREPLLDDKPQPKYGIF